MDVAYPIRAVVPTLDGPVLEVLARTRRPMTGREVHRLTGVGSPNGVRLALRRLVGQGLVDAEERARSVFYVANRNHLAWPAVEQLTGLRSALFEALRAELETWAVAPLHASVFGSAARGDGDEASDIDILLIRPDDVDEDEPPWDDQVDRLRRQVGEWTGNHCQAFQLDRSRLAEHVEAADPMVHDWQRDAVELVGEPLSAILRTLPRGGRR
jgi:nucleotidyltransferase-like protein